MGRISTPKKIRTEDFGSENKDIVEKIAGVYNDFVDEIYSTLNGRVDFENLNRQLSEITVIVNGTGGLVSQPQIKTALSSKVRGVTVVNALNQVNSMVYPASAPFVSWTINNNLLTILNVTGLQNNSTYKLVLEITG